jgi:hypothetical protein
VIPLGDPVHKGTTEIPSGKSEKLKLWGRKGKPKEKPTNNITDE